MQGSGGAAYMHPRISEHMMKLSPLSDADTICTWSRKLVPIMIYDRH